MRNKTPYIRLAIVDSFLKLLESRPFEKVTVKDIVEECGVTRNTFYNYFEDTYDIVDTVLRQQISELSSADAKGSLYDLMSGIVRIAGANPKIIYHLYRSPKWEELLQYFEKAMELTVRGLVARRTAGMGVSAEDEALIVDVVRHAVSGLLLQWIKDGMQEEMEGKIRRIEQLFGDTVSQAIERAAESGKN